MVVKETGSQADTSSCCNVGEEGSGMGKSESDLKKALVGADIAKGLAITGSRAADSEGSVRSWLSINGLR